MLNLIETAIFDWIGYNYGSSEKEEPCYNIYEMSKAIVEALEKASADATYVDFERIRRITGYLTEVKRFNDGKQAELKDRVAHSREEN